MSYDKWLLYEVRVTIYQNGLLLVVTWKVKIVDCFFQLPATNDSQSCYISPSQTQDNFYN